MAPPAANITLKTTRRLLQGPAA